MLVVLLCSVLSQGYEFYRSNDFLAGEADLFITKAPTVALDSKLQLSED